jgi:hypothetical protein
MASWHPKHAVGRLRWAKGAWPHRQPEVISDATLARSPMSTFDSVAAQTY